MSNDVNPEEDIYRLGLKEGDDIRGYENQGILRTPEQMAAAGPMAQEIGREINPKILIVDSHSPGSRAIAEHLAFSRHENPGVIIVDEVGEWPARVRETAPTLDPQMLPKQLKNLDSVDPRVLDHRRYAARRKQRQALTKNQLKARRRGGIKWY